MNRDNQTLLTKEQIYYYNNMTKPPNRLQPVTMYDHHACDKLVMSVVTIAHTGHIRRRIKRKFPDYSVIDMVIDYI